MLMDTVTRITTMAAVTRTGPVARQQAAPVFTGVWRWRRCVS